MKFLYHASPNPNLSVLEPQRTISKDKYIGDFVFATADKILAAMYLVPKGYGNIMHPKETPPKILICANDEELRTKDKGGAIYSVDASLFHETPQKELSEYELVSDRAIKPVFKEVFVSAFVAWGQMGVKVEFINQETFDRLAKNT